MKDKKILSWALYDWANSAFATTVIAGFFPVFFKEFWSQGVDAVTSTYYLGLATSLGGLIVAIIAPILGSIADRAGYKKEILFIFTLMGSLTSMALYFVPQGAWHWAIMVYGIASIAFSICMIPYDSLLVDVTRGDKMDSVSAFGYALGYLGGGLLFLLNVLMVLYPNWFGIDSDVRAVQLSFVSVGLWWLIFSIPLFINVKELKKTAPKISLKIFKDSFREIFQTLAEIRTFKALAIFLLAYFFYIEGVNTTIRMAVDYGMSLGFKSSDLITALLVVQFVAFPFAILFGWIGEKWGALVGIYIALFVYLAMSVLATSLTHVSEFYVMAGFIGSVQGGVQSLSRSYFASQIPEGKSGEFFGFYNMLGKFSAVLGPAAIAIAVKSSGNSRAASYVLLSLFIIGALLLFYSSRIRVVKRRQ